MRQARPARIHVPPPSRAAASSASRLRISSGIRMRGAVSPAAGTGGGTGTAAGAGTETFGTAELNRHLQRGTGSGSSVSSTMASDGRAHRSRRARGSDARRCCRDRCGGSASARFAAAGVRVEACERGILDDEQPVEVGDVAVKFHGLGFVFRRSSGRSRSRRRTVGGSATGASGTAASSTGEDSSMFSLPGSSSTVIESSGEGASSSAAALKACSLRFSSALKVVEQTPQRTSPWATRSASAVTRKTVAQSGHWVYTPTPRGGGPRAGSSPRAPPPGRYQTTVDRPALPRPPDARACRRALSRRRRRQCGASRGASSTSGPARMLASDEVEAARRSLPGAFDDRRVGPPSPFFAAFSRVASRACGSMSNAVAAARAEPERGEREDAGAAAVVEQRSPPSSGRIQPFEAERRRRMRAGAEGEPRIEFEHDRGRILGPLARGADPQRRPKRIGRKSLSHSRSQARSATCSIGDALWPAAPSTAASVAASSAGSAVRRTARAGGRPATAASRRAPARAAARRPRRQSETRDGAEREAGFLGAAAARGRAR